MGNPFNVPFPYAAPHGSQQLAQLNALDYWVPSDFSDAGLMFNRALAAGASRYPNGFRLYIPTDLYQCASTAVVPIDNVEIVNDGWGAQIVLAANFGAQPVFWVQAPASGYRYGIKLEGLNLLGGDQTAPIGIQLDSTYHARLDRVRLQHFGGTALYLNGSASQYGAYTELHQCEFENGGAGTAVKTNNHEWGLVLGGHISWYNTAGGIGLNLTSGNYRIIGLSTDECDTAIVVNNCKLVSITGCGFDRGVTRHIRLQGAQYCTVVGNRFHDFAGSGSKACIDVDSSTNAGNVIANNVMLPGTAWNWFIHESGALGTVPNLYTGNQTAGKPIAVQTPATGGGIIRGNSVNPAGPQTAPGIPASGTALVNPFNYDMTVFVAGGTVTAIAIGGTATGLTAGSFRVPAGQSITLTYSVAPSWTWFGD